MVVGSEFYLNTNSNGLSNMHVVIYLFVYRNSNLQHEVRSVDAIIKKKSTKIEESLLRNLIFSFIKTLSFHEFI